MRKTIGWSFVAVFAITASLSFLFVFGNKFGGALGAQLDAIHQLVTLHFNKDELPLTRILLGAVWFWGLFYLVRRYEARIMKTVGWFFLNLGMNSLYVYTISAFVVFFVHLLIAPPGLGNIILNFLLSIFLLGIVQLCVRTKFLMKIIPR